MSSMMLFVAVVIGEYVAAHHYHIRLATFLRRRVFLTARVLPPLILPVD